MDVNIRGLYLSESGKVVLDLVSNGRSRRWGVVLLFGGRLSVDGVLDSSSVVGKLASAVITRA